MAEQGLVRHAPQANNPVRDFFSSPEARPVLREIEAIGLRVAQTPHAGARAYRLLFGSSDASWYLLPSQPRDVHASSLAFAQPTRPLARAISRCEDAMTRLGSRRVPVSRDVQVVGSNRLADVFETPAGHVAFFSGRAGPQRKLLAQCMDDSGRIKGYAKVAATPSVHATLAREASILRQLHGLDLRAGVTPRVLCNEIRDGTAMLVTDAVDTPRGRASSRLGSAHLAFLDELALRTQTTWARSGGVLLHVWNAQLAQLGNALSDEWHGRLEHALWMLASRPELIASRGLAHGDFTPAKALRFQERLFVFDWEHAGSDYPADFDLLRHLDVVARLQVTQPVARASLIMRWLIDRLDRDESAAYRRLVGYHCVLALRGACSLHLSGDAVAQWVGAQDDAAMLDALLAHPRFTRLQ